MTADKLQAVPDEPVLLPGRHYFIYTFEDWDGTEYTVRLKDLGWMPKRILKKMIGGDLDSALEWAASDDDLALIDELPRREIDLILEAWSKDSEVTPGESPSSSPSSTRGRGGRRSKPTSSPSASA